MRQHLPSSCNLGEPHHWLHWPVVGAGWSVVCCGCICHHAPLSPFQMNMCSAQVEVRVYQRWVQKLASLPLFNVFAFNPVTVISKDCVSVPDWLQRMNKIWGIYVCVCARFTAKTVPLCYSETSANPKGIGLYCMPHPVFCDVSVWIAAYCCDLPVAAAH